MDEVGRGCLAGPVVACCLVLPLGGATADPEWIGEVRDSKMLSPAKRADLFERLSSWAADVAVGFASPAEIDAHNILRASHLAMERALSSLRRAPAAVLVDGPYLPRGFPTGLPARALVGGDARSIAIAGASIVAKVWRDEWMARQDERFPGYGFGVHKGYGTPSHREALRRLGPSPLHRMSFAPVRAAHGELTERNPGPDR